MPPTSSLSDPAPDLEIHNLSYPSSSFETAVLTFAPVASALRAAARTFAALPPHTNHFYPAHVPGRGVSVFFSRAFSTGETIILERPALVLPRALPPDALAALPTLVARLPPAQRLSASLLATHDPRAPWAFDMIGTNAYAFALPVPHLPAAQLLPNVDPDDEPPDADIGWVHNMLFLTTARLNHSCSPNTATFWDAAQLTLRIRALRPIAPHAELTITYLHDLCAPRAARHADLLSTYAFRCAYPACLLPAAASDLRRRRLGEGHADLERWVRWRAAPPATRAGVEAALREADTLIALADTEGLGSACLAAVVAADWHSPRSASATLSCLRRARRAGRGRSSARTPHLGWRDLRRCGERWCGRRRRGGR